MRALGVSRAVLRTGLWAGLAAALVDWVGFLGHGAAAGAPKTGTFYSLGFFMVEFVLFGLAGYWLRRHGRSPSESVLGGLVAGLVCGLSAGLPRTLILFFHRNYMAWIQHAPVVVNAGPFRMPWAPLSVLAALVGSILGGIALGAACGAIGSAFWAPEGTEGPQ